MSLTDVSNDLSSSLPVFTTEEKDLISSLRSAVGPLISSSVEDMDCLRFLRARKSNVALATTMLQNWYIWTDLLCVDANC